MVSGCPRTCGGTEGGGTEGGGTGNGGRYGGVVSVLVDLQDVGVTPGDRALFAHLSVTVGTGDRLGVVGINGTGKSTLLRVLAGRLAPDTGVVRRGRGVRTSWLSQTPELPAGTVRDAVGDGWEAAAVLPPGGPAAGGSAVRRRDRDRPGAGGIRVPSER